MSKVAKRYNTLLQITLIIINILWIFNFEKNNILNTIVKVAILIVMLCAPLLTILQSKGRKMFSWPILLNIFMIVLTVLFFIMNPEVTLDDVTLLVSLVVFPLSLILIDEIRISDRVFGLNIILLGLASLFNFTNLSYIKTISLLYVPVTFIIIYFEKSMLVNLIYVAFSSLLLNLLFDKTYVIILLILLELSILAIENKRGLGNKALFYLVIYFFGGVLFGIQFLKPTLPFCFLLACLASRGYIKNKYNLLITANNLEIGGIETSLVNFINDMDFRKYSVTLILEEKKGPLLKEINPNVYVRHYKVFNFRFKLLSKCLNFIKRVMFSILHYHTYEFSCCYATYSYCGNRLCKIGSLNSSIYVHSNYKYVYKDKEQTKEFFDSRKMNEFGKIIFVSKESRDDYLEMYPEQKKKTIVINNFINIKLIVQKREEKVNLKRMKDKKLLVFVGRLDEESKKITRIIDIAKNIEEVELWIIGDGKDKEMYKKMIEENDLDKRVKMLGSINAPYNYMNKADYIILTSDYEGFPVIYLEALALRKEIITTYPVSDDKIDIKERAFIISKDNYVKDVKKILKKDEKKNEEINFIDLQYDRRQKLEKLIEGRL